MSNGKVFAVVGAGPGLGAATARRFAREDFAVALFARRANGLETLQAELEGARARVLSVAMDGTNDVAVREGFARARAELGPPGVLLYNAGSFVRGGILELTPEQFVQGWQANCYGAFLAAREVLPDMLKAGRGTILLSGATGSLRGGARFSGLAVGKFGLRALGQSLAREFGPQGIHVAHVVIDGQIDSPRARNREGPDRTDDTYLQPDAIAETYWQLHAQHPTTWSHEVDLRPYGEKF